MRSGSELAADARSAVKNPAHAARREAADGRGWYGWVARIGLVAKGVSYGIVGILAIEVAVGGDEEAESRTGALARISENGFGKGLLAVLAVGFAAYALWRFVQALAEREDDPDATGEAKKWGKRAGYVGRGLIYVGLTWSTFQILTGPDSEHSQNEDARSAVSRLLDWPAGRWLVALCGLAVLGAGLWNAYRAVTKKFEDPWQSGKMSAAEHSWGCRAAIVGHLARGVVFVLIGLFVTKAAIEYEPKEAIGLDGALQKLAQASYGPFLLGVTAFGLVCYGLYCLLDARYRDVSPG